MAYWDAHSSRYCTVVYSYGKCALHDLRRADRRHRHDQPAARLRHVSHWFGISTMAEFKAAAQAATDHRPDLVLDHPPHRRLTTARKPIMAT